MACNEKTEEISEYIDENCIQNKSHDERETSAELKLPKETANNMNDLKLFEFNSADEVRQRMKEVLSENGPNFEESAEDFIGVDVGDQKHQKNNLHLHLMSKLTGTDDLKSGDNRTPEIIKPMTSRLSENHNTGTSRKRAGRPPKAGPSKKLKKPQVSTLYWGKLSNVVFLKRDRGING